MSTLTLDPPRRTQHRRSAPRHLDTRPPWSRQRWPRHLRGSRAGLAAVLAIQVGLSLRLNATAFQDEALYLDAGHQILRSWTGGPPPTENFASYFSGSPYVYPPVGALVDSFGGLAGARLLSLACCLLTTLLVAAVGRALFGPAARTASAAVFVISGPVLFIGHFATYDAMALLLLVGGLVLGLHAVRAAAARRRVLAFAFGAGVLLSASVVTKYMAALFIPSTLLVLVLVRRRSAHAATDSPAVPDRRVLAAIPAGLALGAAVVVGGWLAMTGTDQLTGLVATTLSRTPLGRRPALEVARHGLAWGAPALVLTLPGAIIIGRRLPALTVLLLVSSLLPIIFQARSGELTSLHKHVAFGLAYAAPLAGAGLAHVLARIDLYDPRRDLAPRMVTVTLAAVLLLASGVQTADGLFRTWADSQPLTSLLRTQVRYSSGHYLVEESEVPRYYLQDVTASWQWNGTYFFYYRDPRTGTPYTGLDAYRHALRDRYFDLVVLRFGPTAALDWQLKDLLADQTRYRRIATLPQPGGWTVWHRTDP
ncbi:glycosyltransferase family 39 protein [Frankia sp. Ag45/Mut15]|uniref:Glycosyltransferase family 39 protein n=1 Tax=Frankia umida TaxID=573489 RepID=A0ABT0JZG4_9ACTN|nr:glycosyltransferase family 39 protein [Frankia umida]MCK9876937.1 glycosyltransferase family 39 protein [Frankia umida]